MGRGGPCDADPGCGLHVWTKEALPNFGRTFLTVGSRDVGRLSFADLLGGRGNASTMGRRSSPRWNHAEKFLRTVPS